MFLILAVVLVLLWIGGFTIFHVTGFLIHLLLIFAVISIIMHFVVGRRSCVIVSAKQRPDRPKSDPAFCLFVLRNLVNSQDCG